MMDAKSLVEVTANLIFEYRASRDHLYEEFQKEGINPALVLLGDIPADLRIQWERVNGLAARVNDHLQILSGVSLSMAETQKIRDDAGDYREVLGRYAA